MAEWVARGRSLQVIPFLVTAAMTASLVFGGIGCVAAPPGPRGPLRGEVGLEAAVDYFSTSLDRGEAELKDGSTVKGPSDHYWAPYTLIPPRAELRVAPLPWMDIGGHLGWLDGGLEARVGLPASPSRIWAINLAAGVRSGRVGAINDTKEQRALFGRLEAYPLVYEDRGRLVLALGVDAGTFYHQIEYTDPSAEREGPGRPSINAVRDELRLETAFGYSLLLPRVSVLAAIEPYAVLDFAEARSPCPGCEPVRFEQSFGVVIVVRLALFFPFERSPEARPR